MDSETKAVVGVIISIIIGICTLGYIISDYHLTKNGQVLQAKTCEQAVLVRDSRIQQSLLLCRIGKLTLEDVKREATK